MKITNKQLKQIIKEEIENLLLEIGEDEGITPETAQALRRCWVHLMMSSYGAGLFRGKRIANTSSSQNTNEVNAKNMTQEAMDYYFDDYTQGGSDPDKVKEAQLVFDYVNKIQTDSGMPALSMPAAPEQRQFSDEMPQGAGLDFQDWVEENIIYKPEFLNYRSALSDHEAYFNHPNSILFDSDYSQEEKDQEERELSQKRRETEKVFEAFRDSMQKDMTPDQEGISDGIIEKFIDEYLY